ncbi:MAG: hypothetical protein H0U18_13410 [Pyrinomonadaceae bacterium]|nr:hypothetical protein [Pyrinomonadaceae bacterium]
MSVAAAAGRPGCAAHGHVAGAITVAVSGMTNAGTVTASIPAAAATDTTGNANAASTSTDNTVTFTVNVAGQHSEWHGRDRRRLLGR